MSKASKPNKTANATVPVTKTKPDVKAPTTGRIDDDFDLTTIDEDILLTGAAADAADLEEKLKGLPRIVRVALLINRGSRDIHDRLIADIEMLRPGLPLTAAFATSDDPARAMALAQDLDHCAVADDIPELRHIADCVRLVSLPMQKDLANSEDYRRVTQTLMRTLARLPDDVDRQLGADVESFCVGWAMIPALRHRLPRYLRPGEMAATYASTLGELTATRRVEAAEARAVRMEARAATQRDEAEDADDQPTPRARSSQPPAPGPHQHLVARLSEKQMKYTRLKDLLPLFEGVINNPLPLVAPPPLDEVRKALLLEFPYAKNVIDTVLSDLVGRPTVLLRPTLILGSPGGGKSFFVRRISELLGVFCGRTDCSRADSTVFAGTDRRWNSAEPCHPFLAIVRARHANPIVLLDELEKAGSAGAGSVRIDGGRLWDCLLGFLESETSSRYPDPVLADVDLSHISYLATANSVTGLPRPLLDRMRLLNFPLPSRDHLGALLPAVIADLARDRGLDASWIPPLDGDEHAAVASAWPGGSVRDLRRLVEVILRDRDINATKN